MTTPFLIPNREAAIIEIVTYCNIRCPGCYMYTGKNGISPSKKNGGTFTVDTFRRYLAFLGVENVQTLDIVGGEPLLVWELLKEVIEICIDNQIKPRLFSNMILMTEKKTKWLFEREVILTGKWNIGFPKSEGDFKLQACLIGANIYEAKKMWNGITMAINGGYKDSLFYIENLLRKENIERVSEFFELCYDLDAYPLIELPTLCDDQLDRYYRLIPTKKDIISMIQKISMVCKRREGYVEVFRPRPPRIVSSCNLYAKSTYARYNGDLQPCSGNKTVIGNFLDPNCSIEKVLNHPIITARRKIASGRKEIMQGECNQCDDWDLCKGGCRASAENIGIFYGTCPSCFNKLNWGE